jgi:hypothetical protein
MREGPLDCQYIRLSHIPSIKADSSLRKYTSDANLMPPLDCMAAVLFLQDCYWTLSGGGVLFEAYQVQYEVADLSHVSFDAACADCNTHILDCYLPRPITVAESMKDIGTSRSVDIPAMVCA